MNSILHSIKRILGINPEYTYFDEELIIHINSALMLLSQLGVGPKDGFVITGSGETWQDFLGENTGKMELVKSYVYLNVKLLWDSGLTSAVINSIEQTIQEYAWRLNVRAESEVNDDDTE